MNTKLIMAMSAVLLAVAGIAMSFAPEQIAGLFGINASGAIQLIVQLLGAMYFAFAMLNWMAKGSYIGGIYNRPIATANFTNFLIGGLALSKALMHNHAMPITLWVLTAAYLAFALLFGVMLSRHPAVKETV